MEWPRGVNFVTAGGGRALCTLHRAEDLSDDPVLFT